MASKSVIVTDENEGYESVNVQIRVAGVNLNNLKSVGKVFHLGGREYSMSRFGTWALHEIRGDSDVATLLSDGGIAAALTWALSQTYREITVWVNNVYDNRFTLEMKKSQKKRILDEIGSGKMAKNLEEPFKRITYARAYEKFKVKLVKIVTEDVKKGGKQKRNDTNYGFEDEVRMNRLVESERVSNLMGDGHHAWAFMMLKRSLEDENDEVARLQKLMRLAICAVRLQNFPEMEAAFSQIINLMKTVDLPVEEVDFYQKEYDMLYGMMLALGCSTRGIAISFAFLEIAKKHPDVAVRLDKMTVILNRISQGMLIMLEAEPGAALKSEFLKYTSKMRREIEFMQGQGGCDSLVKAQCIYYVEFSVAKVNVNLQKQREQVFRETSFHFKRISSCWADLPFVVMRIRLHPEASKYLEDEEFRKTLQEICKKPALLQQKIKDPRIAHANEILTSEFGIFEGYKDVIEAENVTKTKKESATSSSPTSSGTKKPKSVNKKQQAQREKELGNEAYKNKQFQSALSHYDKAISFDPTDAMLHSNKAAVYISQERLDQARSSCLTAINLAQNNDRHDDKDVAKITARLARVEFLNKRPDIALALYQRSLRLHQDPKVEERMKECEEMILALRFMNTMRFPF